MTLGINRQNEAVNLSLFHPCRPPNGIDTSSDCFRKVHGITRPRASTLQHAPQRPPPVWLTDSCGQGSRRSHDSSDLTGRIERRTKSEVLLNSILLHMLSGKRAGTEAVHRTPVSSSHATSLAAMSWFARTLPCSLIGPGRHWQLRFQEWIIMDQNRSDGHFCLSTSSSKPPQQAIGYTTWTARPRPQRVHSGNE